MPGPFRYAAVRVWAGVGECAGRKNVKHGGGKQMKSDVHGMQILDDEVGSTKY